MEDNIPDRSALSCFSACLKAAQAWVYLFEQINLQIYTRKVTVTTGCHIDASITHSPRKPKIKRSNEVINDRAELADEPEED